MSDRKILLRSSIEELTIHPQETAVVYPVTHVTKLVPARADAMQVTVWDHGVEYTTQITLEPGGQFHLLMGDYRIAILRGDR